ncbi:MAG TPA: hypothetical protein VFU14_09975 [Acidimicrobiales bacterium]|nr:hypothetical protein [Acidimicrobiales bacterium]
MSEQEQQHTVASAREAAERDELAAWVADFLASPGSDNPELGAQLEQERRFWAGPVRLPIEQLARLAGPAEHPVLRPVDDDEWRDDVYDMADKIRGGWEPPPVVVTCRDGDLLLEDGNHRVESIRQAGRDEAWAVVGFDDRTDRDGFLAEHLPGDEPATPATSS